MKLYLFSLVIVAVLVQSMASISNHIENHLGSVAQKPPSFCKGLDCPKYTLLKTEGDDYELRKYEAAYWTSTDIYDIDMKDAGSKAFYRLFDYISGNNTEGVKIDMTAPVINHVIPGAGPLCENNFTYSFFVPFKYQESGPPSPSAKNVYTSTIKEHSAYVRQFPGRAKTARDWIQQADILVSSLTRDGVIDQVDQTFLYTAGYDAPFQLFNRHNEVWFFVKEEEAGGYNDMSTRDNKLRWEN